MAKILTLLAIAFSLTALSQPALAQDKDEKASAKATAKAEAKVELTTVKAADAKDEDVPELPFVMGMYLQLSLETDHQFALVAPKDLDGGYAGTLSAKASFGMCPSGSFCHGPNLGAGLLWVRGTDSNEARGENVKETQFLGSLGYSMFWYLSKHWSINAGVSMPFTFSDWPGAQADFGFAVLPSDLLGQYFALDFGVSATYLRTGVSGAGTDDIAMFAIGPYLGLSWEAWGKFGFVETVHPE